MGAFPCLRRAIFAVACLLAGAPGPCSALDLTAEELSAQWRAQAGDIQTAHIEFLHLVNADQFLRPVTYKEVRRILDDCGLGSGDVDLNALGNRLFVKPLPGNQFARCEMWIDGDRARVREQWDAKPATDIVTRPQGDIYYLAAAESAGIYRSGESSVGVTALADLRFLPTLNPGATIESRDGGSIHLHDGRVRIVADTVYRYPIECTWVGESGTVASEILQRNLTEIDGVIVPLTTVHLVFHAGRLRLIKAFTVQDMELNEDVSDAVFRVRIPAGVTVTDYRNDPIQGDASFRTTAEIDDLLDRPARGLASVPPAAAAGPVSAVTWLVGGGLVLAAVVALLAALRRARGR